MNPRWIAPKPGWFCLNVDGSISASSQLGKIGGLVRNTEGDWIVGFTKTTGISNILHIELWALYEGLKLSWDFGFERLIVYSDCRQAVELLNDHMAGSSSLSLVSAIDRIRRRSWITEITWTSREVNRPADRLAKLDDPLDFSLRIFNEPSLEVTLLVDNDKSSM
ncbi:hypothetical protein V6N11_050854 [Hibiscus sabdariffa]|uniref:Uncharacterized protein n=2 Tax=Hibiscus sabdariffa TaxID=183260 RepID=A0ABR2TBU7_9ROSI